MSHQKGNDKKEDKKEALPWGLDVSKLEPASIDASKLDEKEKQTLTKATYKKTPYQKRIEEAERRKKREEDEAKAALEEFVKDFEGDTVVATNRVWKRGGTYVQKGSSESTTSTNNSRDYRPSMRYSRPKEGDEEEKQSISSSIRSGRTEKKMRAIDKLKAEFAKDQQKRDERIKRRTEVYKDDEKARMIELQENWKEMGSKSTDKGSFDTGDPTTTNLYVGNLAPQVTEAVLATEFGKYGIVQSVKIMWPRTEEERRRKRNCGFVQFVHRRDAERAKDGLNGFSLFAYEMRIGWGKAVNKAPVSIPTTALPTTGGMMPPGMGSPGTTLPPPSGPPGAVLPSIPPGTTPPPGAPVTGLLPIPPVPHTQPGWHMPPGAPPPGGVPLGQPPQFAVILPPPDRRKIIDPLAQFTARDGKSFEDMVRQREAGKPEFAFLFNEAHPECIYFRWKVASLLSGDSIDSWHLEPMQLVPGGPILLPPALPSKTNSKQKRSSPDRSEHESKRQRSDRRSNNRDRDRDRDRDRSRDRDRDSRRHHSSRRDSNWDRNRSSSRSSSSSSRPSKGRYLPSRKRDTFEDDLRKLTISRESIKNVMGFCIDHSEFAQEIVQVITESLTLSVTPIPIKIARLFLVSDIIHNSTASVRNASAYRTCFEKKLPEIFKSLHEVYARISGRMTAAHVKDQILSVLRVWEAWSLYPPAYLSQLRETLLETDKPKSIPSSVNTMKTQQDDVTTNMNGIPLDDENGDIDGVPLNNDDDGDIDGIPLIEGDIDGVPLDDGDIDGIPL